MKDYYNILGLSENASTNEVKDAYKKLCKKFHPDVNRDDKFFENKFKDLQEAYEILIDEKKRGDYNIERGKHLPINDGKSKKQETKVYLKNILVVNDSIRKPIFVFLLLICIVFNFVSAPIALVMGLLVAFVMGNPFIDMNKKATTILLQVSVVCLGFNMNFEHAMKAGKEGFFFTIGTIAITLAAGYFIGKKLKIDKNISLLISNGTAICGGSAIAAIGPIIKANAQQMSVALGTIFILNSIALLIFPGLGHFFQLTDQQFGTWCAVAIHDTSSVVGAASKYSKEALEVATTIKLERALWIIPLSLITAYFQKNSGKIKIPYFIFYFIIAILISTYLPVWIPVLNNKIGTNTLFYWVFLFGRKGLIITLFLIGSGLSLNAIRQVGWRPIVQGVLLWLIIGSVSLLVIKQVV